MAEGEIGELHIGLKGTMNARFLKDLADKTRRGLRGRVEQGRSAGGLSFGYDIVRALDGGGEPVRGGRAINDAPAATVRRVFEMFAAGESPTAIAKALDAEGVPGPGGRSWRDTTIWDMPSGAQGCCATSCMSAAWFGTGCVLSKTPPQAGGCRA